MDAALRWTSPDLAVMPDNGKRYEIIDGELYVSKPTQYQHQLPCNRIADKLNDWGLKAKRGVAACGVRVIFAEDDDVIPDAVWISRNRLNRILGSDGYFHAAPDLAIEVLSPGDAHEKRDREVKRKLYSRRGVLEYWIINWQVNDITVYRRREKALRKHSILRGSDVLTSPLLPGFQCPIRAFSPTASALAINSKRMERKVDMKKRVLKTLILFVTLALFVSWLTRPTCACAPKRSPLDKVLQAVGLAEKPAIAAQRKTKLLFVTECKGFRHAALHQAEEIMEQLGAKNGWDVDITQMAEVKLTPENLKNLDVIVFYTTGELPLSDAQKTALLNWVKSGKFFYGIHSATDTFYKWPEYGQMIGGYFNQHPWTENVEVTIKTEDRTHPVTRHLPEGWTMKEEIYQIKDFIGRDKAHVLVSLDQSKTDMTRKGVVAKDFPLVWWQDYGKGKVMYNEMGHRPDVWTTDWYQTMTANAIKWGTGQLK